MVVESRISGDAPRGVTSQLGQVTLVGEAASIRKALGVVVKRKVNLMVQKERMKAETVMHTKEDRAKA